MTRTLTLTAVLVATALLLPACGGSSGGGNNGAGGGNAPQSLGLNDCLVMTYTDGSGDLSIYLTQVGIPSRLRYFFLDAGGTPTLPLNQNNGTADWTYSPSGSFATFSTPNIVDETASAPFSNSFAMNWTSTTGGTATDTGGDMFIFVYFANGTGPAAAAPYLTPGTQFFFEYTAGVGSGGTGRRRWPDGPAESNPRGGCRQSWEAALAASARPGPRLVRRRPHRLMEDCAALAGAAAREPAGSDGTGLAPRPL